LSEAKQAAFLGEEVIHYSEAIQRSNIIDASVSASARQRLEESVWGKRLIDVLSVDYIQSAYDTPRTIPACAIEYQF
jgi:hypothetical protein